MSSMTPAWATSLRHHPVVGAGETKPADEPSTFWTAASIAGTTLGAYHGYKRTDSIGWAIGWGLLGGIFPFITLPIAYAQGFGKRE